MICSSTQGISQGLVISANVKHDEVSEMFDCQVYSQEFPVKGAVPSL